MSARKSPFSLFFDRLLAQATRHSTGRRRSLVMCARVADILEPRTMLHGIVATADEDPHEHEEEDPHHDDYHPAGVDVVEGFDFDEWERLENIPFDTNLSTKTPPALTATATTNDNGHSGVDEDILTFVLDFKDPTEQPTSDIFGNQITFFDVTSYGFNASDFDVIAQSIIDEVDEDYFDELVGTVAGPQGQDLEVDFIIGNIGTPPPGITEYYFIQIGTGVAGPHSGGTLGVAGGSVVRNAGGNGPNFGIQPGDVVASVFTDAIQTIGGLAPANALSSGNLAFTTAAIAGTTSHEIGHTVSLSHVNFAGSVNAIPGTAPIMGTGAIDLPNQQRITDRSFTISGQDNQQGGAPVMHVAQLVGAIGLHNSIENTFPPFLSGVPENIAIPIQTQFTRIAENAIVTDADSANFDGALLRVISFFAQSQAGDELRLFSGNGVTISSQARNASVSVDGVEIGSVEAIKSRGLDIRLNENATPERTQRVLRQLHMRASNEGPDRRVRVFIEEFNGLRGQLDTRVRTNLITEAPVVSGLAATQSLTIGTGFNPIAAAIAISDTDSPNFDGGLFRAIQFSTTFVVGDELRVRSRNGVSITAQAVGGLVRVDGINIGTIEFKSDRRTDIRLNEFATPARLTKLAQNVDVRATADGVNRRVRVLVEERGGVRGQADTVINTASPDTPASFVVDLDDDESLLDRLMAQAV